MLTALDVERTPMMPYSAPVREKRTMRIASEDRERE
jgi:hypothetical protein